MDQAETGDEHGEAEYEGGIGVVSQPDAIAFLSDWVIRVLIPFGDGFW